MYSWYYLVDQTQHGPVTEADLRAAIAANQVSPDTFVWREGMGKWTPAHEVPTFATQEPTPHLLPPGTTTPLEPVHLPGSYPVILEQKKFLRGKQTISLLDANTLTYQNRRGRPARNRRIEIDKIEAEPKEVRRNHYQSLLLMVPSALLALLLLADVVREMVAGDYASAGSVFAGAIIFALPAVALFYHMKANTMDVFSFSVKGEAPLDLWKDYPDAPTVTAFVEQLKALINRTNVARAAAISAAPPAPTGCVNCQSPDVVPGFATPLCAPCREKLIRTPFPLWLKGAMAVLVVILGVAAFRVPHELSASTALQRGKSAEDKGNWPAALDQYQKALAMYPHSPEVLRGLARTELRAGDKAAAQKYAVQLVAPNGEVNKDDVELIQQSKAGAP